MTIIPSSENYMTGRYIPLVHYHFKLHNPPDAPWEMVGEQGWTERRQAVYSSSTSIRLFIPNVCASSVPRPDHVLDGRAERSWNMSWFPVLAILDDP